MTDTLQVDIVVEGADPAAVAKVRDALADLDPTTLESTRELLTIITVVSAAVALTQKLVDLWKSTRAEHGADDRAATPAAGTPATSNIVIEVQSGATLVLNQVTSAAQIEQFVATHAAS